jgi:ribose transport system substrate-binding protein
MKTKLLLLATGLATALFTSGCGRKDGPASSPGAVHTVPEATRLKFALIPNAPTTYWNIAKQALKKFEKETGTQVDFLAPPTGKVQEQNQIIEDLTSQGYDGIILCPIAAKDQVREIDKASEHLNVITTDCDAPGSRRLAYLGPDLLECGRLAGKEAAALLPEGGKIAIFCGSLTADNVQREIAGIREGIAGTKIEIASMKEDDGDQALARAQVEDAITAIPDVKLMIGLWSYNGPAIASALKASGKTGQIKAIAFGEEGAVLEGIDDGTIHCTFAVPPFEVTYRAAMLLREVCHKGAAAVPSNPVLGSPFTVVKKENLASFRSQMAEYQKW